MTLTASSLDIGYGQTTVARGIDFNIAPGEVHCLLGPNGCGKTTLFRTLLGLLPPLHGHVAIAGHSLKSLPPAAIARHLAYVPQHHVPPFSYSVFDVVLMGRHARQGLFAAPSAADREHAQAALQRAGIAELAERDYSRLSGGQRQLVLIARALAQDADILVLDEPTASLDYGNQIRIIHEIARLAQTGKGIVLSTHNPEHAFAIATRVTVLRDGEVIASGAPNDILTTECLSALYGVPIMVSRDAAATTCRPVYA